MRETFDDAVAPSRSGRPSSTRCSARASIWHEGWKAVTTHPTIAGWGNFNDDVWELYHVDVDRAELNNLAAEQPDKLRELVNIWFAEAGANGAFPLDDRSPVEILSEPDRSSPRRGIRYAYFPGDAPVSEWQAVNIEEPIVRGRRTRRYPEAGSRGVLFAHGTRFGGHALYVKDGRFTT